MLNILITGGNGQLGLALTEVLGKENRVIALGKEDLDVTNLLMAEKKILELKPDIVIHCGAMTDVDRCEIDPGLAFRVNAYGAQNVAIASSLIEAKVVYISTNFVFNGKSTRPYKEGDKTDPVNIYGLSKLLGEKFIRNVLKRYFIIRTGWLYGKGKNNFVDKIIPLTEKKKHLKVVRDQVGTPTLTTDLALVINKIIQTDLYGIYHITNGGYCNRYQWVEEIIHLMGAEADLIVASKDDFSNPAVRPEYAVLDNRLVKERFGIELRDWREGLKDYLSNIDVVRKDVRQASL